MANCDHIDLPIGCGLCFQHGRITRDAARIAEAFHQVYERIAPTVGYQTRPESARPWQELPERNRYLMASTVQELLHSGVIEPGSVHG